MPRCTANTLEKKLMVQKVTGSGWPMCLKLGGMLEDDAEADDEYDGITDDP